jgi:hypothetical protein
MNALMLLGMVTPYMLQKLKRPGNRRYYFIRQAVEALAFALLGNSIYANEGCFVSLENASNFATFCTMGFFITQIISPMMVFLEIHHRAVWVSPNLFVPQIYSRILSVTPILCHIGLGTAHLNALYRNQRIGKCIYYVSILTSVCVSFDQKNVTFVLRKVMTVEQLQRRGLVLWPVFWTISAVTSSTFLLNWKVGMFLISCVGFATWSGKWTTPKSVYDHLASNQKDLFVLET